MPIPKKGNTFMVEAPKPLSSLPVNCITTEAYFGKINPWLLMELVRKADTKGKSCIAYMLWSVHWMWAQLNPCLIRELVGIFKMGLVTLEI